MKLKQLESHLSQIKAFEKPKIEYEQYPTSAHIASHMMFAAQDSFEDLEDQTVLDLGVGCGILSIASGLMGASYNMGIDIDPDALEQTKRNADTFDLQLDLMRMDVNDLVSSQPNASCSLPRLKADTVIMNPPFGTKTQKGVDLVFLQAASLMAERSIYSLHKTSTREHVLRKAKEWGLRGQVVAELHYDLPATYKFHKKKSVTIEVDFLRFEVI